MGKLDGKIAVITAATSGMALATAKLFVDEGAYVFITGRRQKQLDDAVKAIGRKRHRRPGRRGEPRRPGPALRRGETREGRIDVGIVRMNARVDGTGSYQFMGRWPTREE